MRYFLQDQGFREPCGKQWDFGASGIKIGVDPLGGAAIDFWNPIAEGYGLSRKSGTHTFRTARSIK